MSQIKSITIGLPIDTISFEAFTISKIADLSDKQLKALEILADQCGEIAYEKPQILKRPDGSVISVPDKKDFEDYLFIDPAYDSMLSLKINYELSDCSFEWISILFAEGKVFLQEDKHLGEKKAQMLTKQLEIQFEIDRLNAEENFNKFRGAYYFSYDEFKVSKLRSNYNAGQKFMSEKTAETILAKYSQNELKQYLGIII